MEITWLGQSCFRIKTTHGIVITDPCGPDTGYTLVKLTARIVTVSHDHRDHNYVEGITGEFKVINRPGEYEINNILIFGIPTFHDAEHGQQRGKNVAYRIETDDLAICHLGDLGHPLSASLVEQLQNCDVLMIPVGGVYTINATTAAEIVRQLTPKVVIPMHYKTPQGKIELETVDRFLQETGAAAAVPQPKLNISRSSAPETTQVVLLDYPHETDAAQS
ncbi:MAG: MBL fold metallo-hydrolase [Dehalococcoidales bacterium]|nr:MBL fold metallo-hydrolase [Dehalococcoidales bacterium]